MSFVYILSQLLIIIINITINIIINIVINIIIIALAGVPRLSCCTCGCCYMFPSDKISAALLQGPRIMKMQFNNITASWLTFMPPCRTGLVAPHTASSPITHPAFSRSSWSMPCVHDRSFHNLQVRSTLVVKASHRNASQAC